MLQDSLLPKWEWSKVTKKTSGFKEDVPLLRNQVLWDTLSRQERCYLRSGCERFLLPVHGELKLKGHLGSRSQYRKYLLTPDFLRIIDRFCMVWGTRVPPSLLDISYNALTQNRQFAYCLTEIFLHFEWTRKYQHQTFTYLSKLIRKQTPKISLCRSDWSFVCGTLSYRKYLLVLSSGHLFHCFLLVLDLLSRQRVGLWPKQG